jgi:purine-binding chemotaxis protein CheW
MRWRSELIRGMGRRCEDFIIILDINAVFSSTELASITMLPGEHEPADSPYDHSLSA